MVLFQKSRSIFGDITDYFLTPMDDYPNTSSFRMTVYLLEGVLIGSFTYMWLEYAQMGALYHWLYPIIVSAAIILGHYVVSELVFKHWQPLKTTILKFWVISFAGVSLSFIIVQSLGVCGILCRIIGSYCPEEWHTSVPNVVAVFFKTVLIPWGISTFLLTQGVLKKQLAKELSSIKQINDVLGQENIKEHEKGAAYFEVQLKEGSRKIALSDIYFIAVEDHYCKLVINRNGEIHEEFVRLSLKEALVNLPSNYFAQVHRSYAVNLQHIKHIKKEGQAYQLFIKGSENFLPASRHRARTFLPKLKEILN